MDENEIQELLDEAIKTELQTLTSTSNDEMRTKAGKFDGVIKSGKEAAEKIVAAAKNKKGF